jgi:hypothetical protein
MKNFNIYNVTVLFVMVLISSCKKDWFDIKSEDKLVVPGTLKDFQALLDGRTVMNFVDVSLGEVASDGHFVSEINYNQFDQNSKNAYTWSKEQPYRQVIEWGIGQMGAYVRIYYCNLILDGLTKLKERDLNFNNIKGQALFQRARTFYQLSQVFAPPYQPGNSDNELGIPLRLESDINIPSNRSTLKETYDQIINDLLLAKDLLPDLPEFKSRGSKASVYGLLARVYLSIEDYKNASEFANLSLEIYDNLIDYNTLDINSAQPIGEFNSECIFHAAMSATLPVNSVFVLVDFELFDSYEDNDLRKSTFFQRNLSDNTISYKGSYSGDVVPFTGIATDELYLIRSECFARQGKTLDAMKDLNTLLAKRYKPGFLGRTASDKDDALRQILAERKKELLMRGLRWSDLRRLNRDDRFKVTLTRKVNGKTYSLEPNSYKYTFPIPEDIVQMSGIPQNKGWE